MLYFCTTDIHAYVIKDYLNEWGSGLRDDINTVSYSKLFTQHRIPVAPFIFADLERLSQLELTRLEQYWCALSEQGIPVLNHPTRYLKRYELLRTLHERGINQYNIYRLDEDLSNITYPVFIRVSDDHNGPLTELIDNLSTLESEIERLSASHKVSDLVIIEFLDYREDNGIYYKYSVYKVGGEYVYGHMSVGKDWVLRESKIHNEEILKRENEYIEGRFNLEEIQAIFKIANADYGRIDYAYKDGRIQVFEINSAPNLGFTKFSGHPRYSTWKSVFDHIQVALSKIAHHEEKCNVHIDIPGQRLKNATWHRLGNIILTWKYAVKHQLNGIRKLFQRIVKKFV